jgi:hypothetical protein
MGDCCPRLIAVAAFAALLLNYHTTGSRLWLYATAAIAAKRRLLVDLGSSKVLA